MVADFVEKLAIDLLANDAAVADHFTGCFQDHRPEADTVFLVSAAVADDPFRYAGAIDGRGIVRMVSGSERTWADASVSSGTNSRRRRRAVSRISPTQGSLAIGFGRTGVSAYTC